MLASRVKSKVNSHFLLMVSVSLQTRTMKTLMLTAPIKRAMEPTRTTIAARLLEGRKKVFPMKTRNW